MNVTIVKNRCGVCLGALRPLIDRLQDSRFGVSGEYSAGECRNCGAISTMPRPSERELSRLYSRFYNFGGSGKGKYERIREAIHKSVVYKIWLLIDGDIAFQSIHCLTRPSPAQRATSPGARERLIELGCNEGRNLEIYRRNGWKAEGQEINPVAVKTARARGFKVYAGALEKVKGQFDVVVLANVLEHSIEPRQMLSQVHRLLKKGGEVWISLPNNRSWLRSVFGRKWINWHVPFHVSHLGSRSLGELLSCQPAFPSGRRGHRSGDGQPFDSSYNLVAQGVSVGKGGDKYLSGTDNRKLKTDNFKVVSIKTITPALWVAQSVIAAIFARAGKPTRQLRNPILVAGLMLVSRFIFFPFLIAGDLLGKGDALVVRAVKN